MVQGHGLIESEEETARMSDFDELSGKDMLMCLNPCQFSWRPVVPEGSKKSEKKTHAKPERIRYKTDEVKLVDLQFYKVDYSGMV